jgi:uncharacterized protein (DUF2235 family)
LDFLQAARILELLPLSGPRLMAKNIALFIDGTWNWSADKYPTNVKLLYDSALAAGGNQVCHYLPGVGTEHSGMTFEPRFLRYAAIRAGLRYLPRWVRNLLGAAFGWGTAFKIKEAYAFLCNNYKRGDSVYLFGFSRGAFAARSLAGFVSFVGVLYQHELHRVEEAYRVYESNNADAREALADYVQRMTGTRPPLIIEGEPALPIYMIGVWDTVGALGIRGRNADVPAWFTEHHQVELPKNITHARHALALHELRKSFEPLLWSSRQSNQSLVQAWFPGAHADVGGGYKENGHSVEALRWMGQEAAQLGLRVDPSIRAMVPRGDLQVHHQLRGIFLLASASVRGHLEKLRPVTAAARRSFCVHQSVQQRFAEPSFLDYKFLRPRVNAMLRRVDKLTLMMMAELALTDGLPVIHRPCSCPASKGSTCRWCSTAGVPCGTEQRLPAWTGELQPADAGGLSKNAMQTTLDAALDGAVNARRALFSAMAIAEIFEKTEGARLLVEEACSKADDRATAIANVDDLAELEQTHLPRLKALKQVLDELSSDTPWKGGLASILAPRVQSALTRVEMACRIGPYVLGTSKPIKVGAQVRLDL